MIHAIDVGHEQGNVPVVTNRVSFEASETKCLADRKVADRRGRNVHTHDTEIYDLFTALFVIIKKRLKIRKQQDNVFARDMQAGQIWRAPLREHVSGARKPSAIEAVAPQTQRNATNHCHR